MSFLAWSLLEERAEDDTVVRPVQSLLFHPRALWKEDAASFFAVS